jgi:hypothetical protein
VAATQIEFAAWTLQGVKGVTSTFWALFPAAKTNSVCGFALTTSASVWEVPCPPRETDTTRAPWLAAYEKPAAIHDQ